MSYRSSVPLYWRLNKPRYTLAGKKCAKCGSAYFPPRPLCQKCRSKGSMKDFTFSGKGKILSWTIIRAAPEGFEHQAPYAVAIIELKEGTNIAGQITSGIEKIEVGKPVRAVFRRMYADGSSGLIHYGVKWEIE